MQVRQTIAIKVLAFFHLRCNSVFLMNHNTIYESAFQRHEKDWQFDIGYSGWPCRFKHKSRRTEPEASRRFQIDESWLKLTHWSKLQTSVGYSLLSKVHPSLKRHSLFKFLISCSTRLCRPLELFLLAHGRLHGSWLFQLGHSLFYVCSWAAFDHHTDHLFATKNNKPKEPLVLSHLHLAANFGLGKFLIRFFCRAGLFCVC